MDIQKDVCLVFFWWEGTPLRRHTQRHTGPHHRNRLHNPPHKEFNYAEMLIILLLGLFPSL